MFDPAQALYLYGKDLDKVKEILNYVLRGNENDSIYTCFPAMTTINKKNGSCTNYIQVPSSCVIYYIIPKFFNVGRITADLADPIGILNFFYDEYKRRIQSEETSEEIPIKEEIYEQSAT